MSAERKILVVGAAAFALALALAGCSSKAASSNNTTTTSATAGSSSSTTTTAGTSSASGTSLSMPVTSARDFAGTLVTLGLADPDLKADAFGAPDVWTAHGLPKSALDGSSIVASATVISGYTTVSAKSGAYEAYPFAVSDGKTCVYAVIYTTESNPKAVGKVYDANGACTGSAALDQFEATILGT
jgi:hypothetical protein